MGRMDRRKIYVALAPPQGTIEQAALKHLSRQLIERLQRLCGIDSTRAS